MFFPEHIKLIAQTDRVLEIGPGGMPYHRSDVLLEKNFSSAAEATSQRGNAPELQTDKTVIYYDGGRFPFRDKEFDYVICSHVLEHVPDVEFFVNELFRVAAKGYVEFPTIYYEYLYNFPAHLNFMNVKGDIVFYLPKAETPLSDFELIQTFFLESLNKGYKHLVDQLKPAMFVGFEWSEPFSVRKASSLKDLTLHSIVIPEYSERTLVQKVFDRIRGR